MNAPQRNFTARRWKHLPVPAPHTYAISNAGEVCRLDSGKILKPCVMKRGGYLAVNLWAENKGKLCPVHQLVAFGFHGPRPSPRHHAAHLDGNKLNNTRENIAWCTKEENEAHKKLHGTDNAGERNGHSKITAETVLRVRADREAGGRICEIARAHGLKESHVSLIANRQIWRHV